MLDAEAAMRGQPVGWQEITSPNQSLLDPRFNCLVAPCSDTEIVIMGGLFDGGLLTKT